VILEAGNCSSKPLSSTWLQVGGGGYLATYDVDAIFFIVVLSLRGLLPRRGSNRLRPSGSVNLSAV
jgi:hypothetical protein